MHELQITFRQVDVTAKPNITDIRADATPWSNLDDLRYDNVPLPGNYSTNEPNHAVLNGTMDEFPDEPDPSETWGLWSEAMSGEDRVIGNPVVIEIEFSANQKSRGITIFHYPHTPDYTSLARATWYNSDGTISQTGVYELSSLVGVISESATYRKIRLELLETNNPFRYVRIYAIDFGITRIIFDHEIHTCDTLEEIDPTSESISVNVMNATIRTRNSIFSPITSPNYDGMVMRRQQLDVTRDGVPFGTFFLDPDGWEDPFQSGVETRISASDAMSILDNYPFMGDVYVDKPVIELLAEILDICFPTKAITFLLDPTYENATVSGWIPSTNYGVALQHICFALNATADTARENYIWIYPREEDIKADGHPISDDKQPFVNLEDLRSHREPFYYATNEPNYPLLDGEINEFPDDTSDMILGWRSETMSDENGMFAEPYPSLNIPYGTNHNLDEMTINFGLYENEYIKKARITFFDEYDNVLHTHDYEFTSNPGKVTDRVYGYRRMLIQAMETSNPFRNANISSLDYGESFFIPLIDQYRKGRDRPTEYFSGVEVISHEFTRGTDEVEAVKAEYSAGVHTITFREPLHSLVPTGCTIISSNANHAVVDVPVAREITISGRAYIHNRRSHIVREEVAAEESDNIKRYEDYTLVSPDIGLDLAAKIFEHKKLRVIVEQEIVLRDREVGYIAQIETWGHPVTGVISCLESNLRAGTSRINIIGNVVRSMN